MWLTVVLGVVPLLIWLFYWWNNIWYGLVTRSSINLPPGYMGLPVVGEMFTFFWYFKFLRRPDDYINSKRNKYGDGIGMYKTHLFGTPSIIVYSPTAIKFVFRDEESFIPQWPNVELLGKTSLAAVHGKTHARLRSFVTRSVNQPEALRRIAITLQPTIISALDSWAKRRTITSYKEIKKVMFENIGMIFASFKPGPTLDMLSEHLVGLINGIRSYPVNLPGFAYYHGLQTLDDRSGWAKSALRRARKRKCVEEAIAIFKEELEKRKKNFQNESNDSVNDLIDCLMKMKDEEGVRLSDTEILDNIINVILGAYEATTLATMWAVYYLAKFPRVLQKLRDETMSLKRDKNEQVVTSEEIFKMKYTMKVVDETIRMANISSFLFRTTSKDVNYKGYTIPKGWNAMLWIRYLHTNPENFNDPLSFNPDRWEVPMAPGTYQVFGGGAKICAGNMLARLQLAVFIYHLSTGYRWELMNPDAKVRYLSHPKPEDGVEIIIEKL